MTSLSADIVEKLNAAGSSVRTVQGVSSGLRSGGGAAAAVTSVSAASSSTLNATGARVRGSYSAHTPAHEGLTQGRELSGATRAVAVRPDAVPSRWQL